MDSPSVSEGRLRRRLKFDRRTSRAQPGDIENAVSEWWMADSKRQTIEAIRSLARDV
jgi:hypothetical protein